MVRLTMYAELGSVLLFFVVNCIYFHSVVLNPTVVLTRALCETVFTNSCILTCLIDVDRNLYCGMCF